MDSSSNNNFHPATLTGYSASGLNLATGGSIEGSTIHNGSTTLNAELLVPYIAGASAGVLHAASGTGNVTNSLIVNADITNLTIADGKLATVPSTSATASTLVKRGASGEIASGPLTVAGSMRVDATIGGGLNEFDLTQSLSDYYNHLIAGGSPYGGLNLETAGTGASNTYKMPGDGVTKLI